jgi:hypothetical protein
MQYDIIDDGERFLLTLPTGEQQRQGLMVELNWRARLQQ